MSGSGSPLRRLPGTSRWRSTCRNFASKRRKSSRYGGSHRRVRSSRSRRTQRDSKTPSLRSSPARCSSRRIGRRKDALPIELFDVPALWAAVERLAASASISPVSLVALDKLGQHLGESLPPPSEDARWMRVLTSSPNLAVRWMRRAAGRLGDPKILEIARADLARTAPDSGNPWPLDLVATYRGPGGGHLRSMCSSRGP